MTVHVLANGQPDAIDQPIQMYSSVRKRLEEEGHIPSPIEVKEPTATPYTESIDTLLVVILYEVKDVVKVMMFYNFSK